MPVGQPEVRLRATSVTMSGRRSQRTLKLRQLVCLTSVVRKLAVLGHNKVPLKVPHLVLERLCRVPVAERQRADGPRAAAKAGDMAGQLQQTARAAGLCSAVARVEAGEHARADDLQ